MKNGRRIPLLAAGLALVLLLVLGRESGTRSWDLSNLEISPEPAAFQRITPEEAVSLKTKLTRFPQDAAKKALEDLEAEILAATGSGVVYYQFVGPFTIPGIEALSGDLTTLLAVADGATPFIYAIETPATQVRTTQDNVQWTQMATSCIIGPDKTSARLAATGYLAVTDGGPYGRWDRLSNTLYPTYTVSLE